MVLKRNVKWVSKPLKCYIIYLNKRFETIKVFECPSDLYLHDKHYDIMMADPGYFSDI